MRENNKGRLVAMLDKFCLCCIFVISTYVMVLASVRLYIHLLGPGVAITITASLLAILIVFCTAVTFIDWWSRLLCSL